MAFRHTPTLIVEHLGEVSLTHTREGYTFLVEGLDVDFRVREGVVYLMGAPNVVLVRFGGVLGPFGRLRGVEGWNGLRAALQRAWETQ